MKKILALGLLSLAFALAAFFLPSRAVNAVRGASSEVKAPPSPSPSPSPSARAPASVPSPSKKDALLGDLKKTKACYDSDDCDFPQTDPRSYSIAIGRHLASVLAELRENYDPSQQNEMEAVAQEYMQVNDGFVQEQAIRIFSLLPPRTENLNAMISGLENSPDPTLIEQAMKEWERYVGTSDEPRIQEFLADFMAHGGQFSSEKAAELIGTFLNERTAPAFRATLASMVSTSTPAQYLRAALIEYDRQRTGG